MEIRNSKPEIRNKPQIRNGKTPTHRRPRVLNFSCFFILFCFVFRFSNFALSATPPTTKPSDPLTSWFQDLANRDASVREQARINLMGISRPDLERLRKLVETSRPLAPSQAMALHEIVDQAFQATEPYEPIEGKVGFLGVQFPTPSVVLDGADDDSQTGLLVAKRLHGFCAYRFLQDGDMIIGIAEASDHPIRAFKDLTEIINGCTGGDTVHMQVLRGGQKVEVPVKLDARPNWASPVPPVVPTVIEDAIRERQRKSDAYWDQNFAPLLDGGIL